MQPRSLQTTLPKKRNARLLSDIKGPFTPVTTQRQVYGVVRTDQSCVNVPILVHHTVHF